MSLIQKTRDKAAWIVTGAIALALIAFIVQDGLRQGGSLFGGNSTNIGSVDGKDITYKEYQERMNQIEENYRAQGASLNDMMRQQIQNQLWQQFVEEKLLSEQYDKLGLTVSDKELGDILYGSNPPQMLAQQFTDPNTGVYDAAKAYQSIQQLRRQKNTPQYKSYIEYENSLVEQRLREKYTTLLANSMYVPKWMVEKMNTENSERSNITFVNVPYSTIPDSTIAAISDNEVESYVNAHKEMFQQQESRSMDYVTFNAAPTSADSVEVYNALETVKNEFKTATDVQSFLVGNGSETAFFDGYVLQSQMQMPMKDSILAAGEGEVYGPYLDGGSYALSKILDVKSLPDSVFCRHILIKTTGDGAVPDSVAKERIDSVERVIKAGADFVTVMKQVSDDDAATKSPDDGLMKFTAQQIQNKQGFDQDFAQFILFDGQKGERKVIKTQFGYHYIWIVDKKNYEPAYKIAYMSRTIYASDNTLTTALGLASQFAAQNRTYEQMKAAADKDKSVNMFTANEILPMSYSINGLGSSRELVQWLYKEAKQGQVMEQPVLVGDKYVVAVLTNIYEKGIMPVQKARPMVEYVLRNKKKAEQIGSKIKSANATTLEAIAQATSQPVNSADSVSMSTPYIPNAGQEWAVVGASFNKGYQQAISKPIQGNAGVFVIKVNNIIAVPNPAYDVTQFRERFRQQMISQLGNRAVEPLKDAADIKDNRYKFF